KKDAYSNPTSTAMYSAMMLRQKAIKDHADPKAPLDAAAVLAAMYQVKDETVGGLLPPISYSKDNPDRQQPCFWPYIKDGKGNFKNPLGALKYDCYPKQ